MYGLYLIQVAIYIRFIDGFDEQPLYEDKCRVNELCQHFNEAYSKFKPLNVKKKPINF